MTITSASTLEDLADQNMFESIREHARWQQPVALSEADGLLLLAGSTPFPGAYRNAVARTQPGMPAAEALARARAFFGTYGRGFTLWIRDDHDQDLEELAGREGLQKRSDSPRMLVDRLLPDLPLPTGIRIERFAAPHHVADAETVNTEAYQNLGLPPEEARATFTHRERLLRQPVFGVLAYRDDAPLSTALTIASGESAGIYWVGTRNAASRSGLAALCTQRATNIGFERGARVVTLQASAFGEPVYHRLGYRTYGRLRWYLFKPPAAA